MWAARLRIPTYIVKSHDIHIDADYADWISDIKSRYRSAQVKAAVKVNAEKLLFNWQLGRDLVQKENSNDLLEKFSTSFQNPMTKQE